MAQRLHIYFEIPHSTQLKLNDLRTEGNRYLAITKDGVNAPICKYCKNKLCNMVSHGINVSIDLASDAVNI